MRTVPVADGGDGLLDAFVAAGYERVAVRAADALGTTQSTSYVRRGDTAVIELAAVCGLAAVGPVAPMAATSRGVGEVLAAALDAGATRLVLGIGGSASTDGGAGLLQALGAGVLDVAGAPIAAGGAGLATVSRIELTTLHPGLAGAQLELAADVDNPLTGVHGAAAVYAPQKGADPDQVAALDAALTRWADVMAAATGVEHRADPGVGAAGGIGFAAVAALGARMRPGVEVVLELMDFAGALAEADLVVTGEGSLDAQTLRGKAPAGVAAAARAAGVPVVAVAGRCDLSADELLGVGFAAVHSLTAEAGPGEDPLTDPGPLLRRIGAKLSVKAREHRRTRFSVCWWTNSERNARPMSACAKRKSLERRAGPPGGRGRRRTGGHDHDRRRHDHRRRRVRRAGHRDRRVRSGRRGAARPGRHSRARQRARPHRLGGVRVGHPRGRGRRRHHADRHAAEQHPADDDGRGVARQAGTRTHAGARRRRLLGRRDTRKYRRSG